MSGLSILGVPGTGPNAPVGMLGGWPSDLLPIFQQNMLDRAFQDFLKPQLGYRRCADPFPLAANAGQTLTATRPSLKKPATTPVQPGSYASQGTAMGAFETGSGSNGYGAGQEFNVEQFTVTINQYRDYIPLNIEEATEAIASVFMQNVRVNAIQSAQTLERLGRDALYSTYFGGHTFVTTTLSAAGTSIHVDNINGFGNVVNPSTGQIQPVSSANTATVYINGNPYTLVGVTPDSTNSTTTTFGAGATSLNGQSGTLTFSTSVSISDGTANNRVRFGFAPPLIRAGGATSTSSMTSSDILKVQDIINAIAVLGNNGVPRLENGRYICYIDWTGMSQLFADPALQTLFMGKDMSTEFKMGYLSSQYGVDFHITTEAPIQTLTNGLRVHRALVCGKGALLEGRYKGIGQYVRTLNEVGKISDVRIVDGIVVVSRPPIDVWSQVITQGWFWVGGFTVPTDITAYQEIFPTASDSYWKRGVVVEYAGSNLMVM